jgi:hypothetical protein
MDEYVPPVRNWRWLVGAAILAVVVGIATTQILQHRIDQRIAEGRQVSAEVTAVRHLPLGTIYQPQLVTVVYDLDGRRSARLASAVNDGDYRVGDHITVMVDLTDPGRVATSDGRASEGLTLIVMQGVIVYGLLTTLLIATRRGRWWWRHERQAPTYLPLLSVRGSLELRGSAEEAAALSRKWHDELRQLEVAAETTSQGRTTAPRLLIFIRLGSRGAPRAVWYSRRSRRLVVVGPVPAAALAGNPRDVLRDVTTACGRRAEEWIIRHMPGTDVSVLSATIEELNIYQDNDSAKED